MLFIEQALNGLQYGALLFLLASGLTLVFGIMNVINLAHGSFYMVGAFSAAYVAAQTHSFLLAGAAALVAGACYALLCELLVIQRLYRRPHLDQVLATFGITLFSNELVSVAFGRRPPSIDIPPFLAGSARIVPGLDYPVMRLAFIAAGALVALLLFLLINRTRLGMLVRAGADDPEMVDALGVDTRLLFGAVFALGGLLCGFAGVAYAPLTAVTVGMGEQVLITTLVVIVVGGVGSVGGAALGALLVGMTDAFGRAYIPDLAARVLPADVADSVAGALVAATTFALMVAVLLARPRGLLR